jgi:cyanate permease
MDDERDLFLLCYGPVWPRVLATDARKGDRHHEQLQDCLLSAIPFLFSVFTMILCGRSADLQRRWHLVILPLFGAIGFLVASLAKDNTVVALAFLSLAAAGVHTCTALFWSLPTSFLRGIAAFNSIGNLAGFLSPYLVGFLKDATHGNRIGMHMLAAVLALGAIIGLGTRSEEVNR